MLSFQKKAKHQEEEEGKLLAAHRIGSLTLNKQQNAGLHTDLNNL